ncbi:MAG: 4-alpha-glucanotransferase [Acidobacteriaceae bacterium]|nr:4-alpha-glucanotransferase [Acidobacteriaceae bacterium]MBV9501925.1 4-alpha-glucanotransferase [Acidobacteriaceae bacterium]
MLERSEAHGGTQADGLLRTNGWGIDLNYCDALGQWHDVPEETVRAILAAMDADPTSVAASSNDSLMVICTGQQCELPRPGTVVLETGETITAEKRLPGDLPSGYHQMQLDGADEPVRLIVSSGECWLPDALKTWGWSVQLYAARSQDSWGIGDFADLERLAKWSGTELGAGMIMVNPLSASMPVNPQQASPYYPTSRCFFSPLWIHVEWVPGANSDSVPQLNEIASAGRALNANRLIDRDAVFDLKMRALELLWLQFPGHAGFGRFCHKHGDALHRFAIFCALAEELKSGWHSWPEQYRHPDNSAVAQFANDHLGRVQFHKWLQWLLDVQLARSSSSLPLMQDLPIGVDPDGADAWAWQDVFTDDVSVGAPPDEFNTQGQNWGLPPFVPHKLRAAGYLPFIQTIRAALRNAGGLRIDHVMGLFRLFWIPAGADATHGAYVRHNANEMLAILALESERAKAYIVGEDLGTVEDQAREKLARHRVLSYRLLWFEKEDPETYPLESLAAVTTHDLPTIAGLWTGSDLETQRKLHLRPNEGSTREIHERLEKSAGLDGDAPLDLVISGAYQVLARAPSRILTATLEDAAAVEVRPNMPATQADQHPNWSRALPVTLEELQNSDLPRKIAAALGRSSEAHAAEA